MVTYDLTQILAREMDEFVSAIENRENETVYNYLAKLVATCPEEWGAADDPETYANLPYFGSYTDVITGLMDAAKNLGGG